MRLFAILLTITSLLTAQDIVIIRKRSIVVGSTFTLTQKVIGRGAFATNMSCTGSTCTLTVASTGAGHAGIVMAFDGGETLSTVTGGCTWTVQAASKIGSGVGDVGGATCPSLSSGTTSIVLTYSGTPFLAEAAFFEFSYSGPSVSFDTTSTSSSAGCTSCSGPALTLSGSNDVIVQAAGADATPTAASGAYSTNFTNQTTNSESLSFWALSYVMNTSSGSATNWTQSPSGGFVGTAIAMKGN